MTASADTPAIRWADRQAGQEAAQARVARLREAFGQPYMRSRPRNAAEAEFLHAKGTPARLVGPPFPR